MVARPGPGRAIAVCAPGRAGGAGAGPERAAASGATEGVSGRVADKRTEGAARPARPAAESRLGLVPPARTGGRRTLPQRTAPAGEKPRPARPRFRLTRRATVLALAVCAVVVTIAYPLQEYLSQRSQLIAIDKQNADLAKQVSGLQKQISLWNDPGYVAIQARGQLHYVKPGEEGFTVPGPANGGEQLGLPAPTASPWYDTLWGTAKSPGATGTGAP
jgi:cell division protein FtsB